MKKPSDFTKEKIQLLWAEYKKAGGTQVSLSGATGINQGQLSDYIRGNRLPNVDGLMALAQGFGVPIAEFFPPDEARAASPPATGLTSTKRELIDLITGLDEPKAASLLRILRRTFQILREDELGDLSQFELLRKKSRG